MSSMLTEDECKRLDFSKYKLTRKQSIRLKCIDCCGYQLQEVRNCHIYGCPLWPYRMGISEKLTQKTLQNIRKMVSESKESDSNERVLS